MIIIWLPFIPVVALLLFAIFYNKKVGREIIWKANLRKNIFSLILIIIILGSGVYYILDPNEMGRSVSTTSYHYLYTGGRMIGFVLTTIAYTLFYFLFLNSANLRIVKVIEGRYQEPNLQWTGYKVIFLLMCITAILSGAYGRACHGSGRGDDNSSSIIKVYISVEICRFYCWSRSHCRILSRIDRLLHKCQTICSDFNSVSIARNT